MSTTVKAAVFHKTDAPPEIRDVVLPDPGPGQVRVALKGEQVVNDNAVHGAHLGGGLLHHVFGEWRVLGDRLVVADEEMADRRIAAEGLSDGVVHMVIGVGIFKAPAEVAAGSSSVPVFLSVWLVGGLVSLCGALVYAELASRHPETGGEYTYLQRAFGEGTGFVFAWARMTVIQTGAIAAVAFVFGDYASEIYRLGEKSSAIYGAIAVVALTALNLAGTLQTKVLQTVMETILILGLLALAACGVAFGSAEKFAVAPPKTPMSLDFAMLFVLFAYGGWNEAAYLAGEVAEARRRHADYMLGIVETADPMLITGEQVTELQLNGRSFMTLLELLVVVMILVVLAALVVPLVSGTTETVPIQATQASLVQLRDLVMNTYRPDLNKQLPRPGSGQNRYFDELNDSDINPKHTVGGYPLFGPANMNDPANEPWRYGRPAGIGALIRCAPAAPR